MSDAQTVMLDLAHALAQQEARGRALSHAERAVADLVWIDITVAPNGFLGWLDMTTADRLRSTVAALAEIRATRVGELVAQVFAAVGLDPATMTEQAKEDALGALPDEALGELDRLGDELYDATDRFMALCLAYAEANGLL